MNDCSMLIENTSYLSNRKQVPMVYRLHDKPRGMLEEHKKNL